MLRAVNRKFKILSTDVAYSFSFSFCESYQSTERVPTVIDTVDIRSLADTVSTEKTVTHANYQLTLTRTAYLQHP